MKGAQGSGVRQHARAGGGGALFREDERGKEGEGKTFFVYDAQRRRAPGGGEKKMHNSSM